MYEEKTLADLKVGDRVYWSSNYNFGINEIERITKTLIILKNGSRYKRNTGYFFGATLWNVGHISILTPELEEKVYIAKLKNIAYHLKDKILIPKEKEALKQFIEAMKPYCKNEGG